MRTLATLAVIAATFSFTHDASAQGTYYPWCARYDAYAYNCGFVTWQQCQATISGAGGKGGPANMAAALGAKPASSAAAIDPGLGRTVEPKAPGGSNGLALSISTTAATSCGRLRAKA